MEERIFEKPVEIAEEFKRSLADIFNYSVETFGEVQAERYDSKIMKAVKSLSSFYTAHSPCRHIPSKSLKYRNIILDAHLIIYRIAKERIEVLDIVHQASSINKIRNVRTIRL